MFLRVHFSYFAVGFSGVRITLYEPITRPVVLVGGKVCWRVMKAIQNEGVETRSQ